MSRLSASILGVLVSGPANGTGIAHSLRKDNPQLLDGGDQMIYPELVVLESDNTISSTWVQSEESVRKVYSLNPPKTRTYRKLLNRLQGQDLNQNNQEENNA